MIAGYPGRYRDEKRHPAMPYRWVGDYEVMGRGSSRSVWLGAVAGAGHDQSPSGLPPKRQSETIVKEFPLESKRGRILIS